MKLLSLVSLALVVTVLTNTGAQAGDTEWFETLVDAIRYSDGGEIALGLHSPSAEKSAKGLRVTRSVTEGTILASFASTSALVAPAQPGRIPDIASPSVTPDDVAAYAITRGLPPKIALGIRLLAELFNDKSPEGLSAWLDVLPEAFPEAPTAYPARVQDAAQGGLAGRIQAAESEVHGLASVVSQLVELVPSVFPEPVGKDDVAWAQHAVASRGWEAPDGSWVLAPLVDMLPFAAPDSGKANVKVEIAKSGRLLVVALSDLQEGDELWGLGKHTPASQLFATFGPGLGGHDLDQVAFLGLSYDTSSLGADGNVFASTTQALLDAGSCFVDSPEGPVFRFRMGDSALPDPFLRCMRMAMMTPADFARVVAYEEATGDSWPPEVIISMDNELAVHAALHSSFTDALENYATTVAMDAAELANVESKGDDVLSAVIRLRMVEKQLYAAARDLVVASWTDLLLDASAAHI